MYDATKFQGNQPLVILASEGVSMSLQCMLKIVEVINADNSKPTSKEVEDSSREGMVCAPQIQSGQLYVRVVLHSIDGVCRDLSTSTNTNARRRCS